jgi:carbonic anhydrase
MIRSLIDLLEGNRRWMARREAEDEEYFARHARGQSPAFLFIGCSDSRVPPTTITGTGPGELFVTRNIANLVREDDVGVQSALEYALGPLRVEHVIVCGHTSCGGVTAALDGQPSGGALGMWLEPLRELAQRHREELASIEHPETRIDRLAELNVEAQVRSLERHPLVQRARAERPLQIYASVYDLAEGRVRPLETRA